METQLHKTRRPRALKRRFVSSQKTQKKNKEKKFYFLFVFEQLIKACLCI